MTEWKGSPCPYSPDTAWIDESTGERVDATTGERVRPSVMNAAPIMFSAIERAVLAIDALEGSLPADADNALRSALAAARGEG
jgi:hypothetical protein